MNGRFEIRLISLVILLVMAVVTPSAGQDVSVAISTNEAYVGMPVVFQIRITDAQDYELPDFPEIDGCSVRAAGTPSQTSQITIVNGRRSESRSVTMQYLITPRRPGTFQIPALTVQVDGRQVSTRPLAFVASRSETGDLMFVEVEGGDRQVYVGQSLDLKLKIWLKPYRDRQRQIVLSPGQMWQLVSDQSTFGSFADRIGELEANNQRPRDREVIREDQDGRRHSYYLYEVETTVYPTRPGKIDASDIQIVVQYPTQLSRSRDPFAKLFDDMPMGGRMGGRLPGGSSLLRQMMDDDFFASPFGRRLTVSAFRPIVAEVTTDETEVLPIPVQGQPADYRGAVGRYRIMAEAEPTRVKAGDPITLRLGIVGTGPMELVQAPPLSEIGSLTADFRVEDQSLAGFVRDESKIFVTTIRPRRAGITSVPAIPFSFFDPDTESFETVHSEPIDIQVDEAETLSMDAIVSGASGPVDEVEPGPVNGDPSLAQIDSGPDLENDAAAENVLARVPMAPGYLWWLAVVGPPAVWLLTLFSRSLLPLTNWLTGMRPAQAVCQRALAKAENGQDLIRAMTEFIARKTGQSCQTPQQAVGALRVNGLLEIANSQETLFERLQQQTPGLALETDSRLDDARQECQQMLDNMVAAFADPKRIPGRGPMRMLKRGSANPKHRRPIAGLLLCTLGLTATLADAAPPQSTPKMLQREQQETILAEAHRLYQRGRQLKAEDSAEAGEQFGQAAERYQLLIDSGVANDRLHVNLGNAELQRGRLGQAVASFHRAVRLNPANHQAVNNLHYARGQVVQRRGSKESTESTADSQSLWKSWRSWSDVRDAVARINTAWIQMIGLQRWFALLAVASVVFWSLAIIRTSGKRFRFWRWAMLPLLLLIFSSLSLVLHFQHQSQALGVLISDNLELRRGDGEEFPVVRKLESGSGREVRIVAERGTWVRIEGESGVAGWLPASVVERI